MESHLHASLAAARQSPIKQVCRPLHSPCTKFPILSALAELGGALNPFGCGRCPPASNAAREKPLKTRETLVCHPLRMGFSLFFPCSVWGGRVPTAALAEKARDESRKTFRLGIYQIRQADRPTQNKLFFMVFILKYYQFIKLTISSLRSPPSLSATT